MRDEALQLRSLRSLLLNDSAEQPHLSAGSGIWITDNTLYVIADDELYLGVFSMLHTQPGHTLTILPGALPKNLQQRKAAKPDFESLTCLPVFADHPYGALLALGSGSTEQRKRGMLWPFNQQQRLIDKPQIFSLHALYAPLETIFTDLNIEGVVVQGSCVKLWQRGNNLQPKNAVIEYTLSDLYAVIYTVMGAQRDPVYTDAKPEPSGIQPQRIDYYNLGEVAGVPLTFTDAYALADGACIFTAVAEDTDNSYLDGECVAAAIGLIDPQRQLHWLKPVQPTYKLEGISAKQVGKQLQIYLVSDADNRDIAAQLLATQMNYPI